MTPSINKLKDKSNALSFFYLFLFTLILTSCNDDGAITNLTCGCQYTSGPNTKTVIYIEESTADTSAIEVYESPDDSILYNKDSLCNFNWLAPYEKSLVRYTSGQSLTCKEDSIESRAIVEIEDLTHEFQPRHQLSDDHYSIINTILQWDTLNFLKCAGGASEIFGNSQFNFITSTSDWNMSRHSDRLKTINDELRLGNFIGPFLSVPIDSNRISLLSNSTFSILPRSGFNLRIMVPVVRGPQATIWIDQAHANGRNIVTNGCLIHFALRRVANGDWKITEGCNVFVYG